MRIATLAVAFAFLGSLGACGGASSDLPDLRAPLDLAPPPLFDVHVHYDYQGKMVGKFGVGAFKQNPPISAPLAYVRIGTTTFPGDTTLRGVEPGSFYVFAVLDLPPDDPTIPGTTDLKVASDLLTLVDRDLDVSLVLTDGAGSK